MAQDFSIEDLLEIARRTIEKAGCASLITLDNEGRPSSRPVAAFAPDEDFCRIVVGTHPHSRKTAHVQDDPRVVLSYLDLENHGYVTVIGSAWIDEDSEEKADYWVDRFEAFFPGGPSSKEYQLMCVIPERLELRSFGMNVAADPTCWTPVILDRDTTGAWCSIAHEQAA